jgi:hypothetical protein
MRWEPTTGRLSRLPKIPRLRNPVSTRKMHHG